MAKEVFYETNKRWGSTVLSSTKNVSGFIRHVSDGLNATHPINNFQTGYKPFLDSINSWCLNFKVNFYNWEDKEEEYTVTEKYGINHYKKTYQRKYLNGVETEEIRNEVNTLTRTQYNKLKIVNMWWLGGWEGAAFVLIQTELPPGTMVWVYEHQGRQGNMRIVDEHGQVIHGRYNNAGSNLDSWISIQIPGNDSTNSGGRHINSRGHWATYRGIPVKQAWKALYNTNGVFARNFPA